MPSQPQKNSLLCPNCRKLISRSSTVCPYCTVKNPGAWWKNTFLTTGLAGDGLLIRAILGANIFMFVLSILFDPPLSNLSFSPFGFLSPSNKSLLLLGSTGSIPLFQLERWWTLLSANYLHGSLLHIVFNMIAVSQLAPLVIREYGSNRMIALYTLGGIAGFLISSLVGVRFTIGASAAVCSLIGAMLYYGKSRGGIYGQEVFRQIGGWAVGIAIFGFLVPGINNWGHGGGMLAGVILGYLLGYQERRRENINHKYLGMACIIATVLTLLWACFSSLLFFLS